MGCTNTFVQTVYMEWYQLIQITTATKKSNIKFEIYTLELLSL